MLKLKNVSKFYYNKGIIASGFTKINLELKMGEFIVITGESGSGKSTLLNVISGLDSYEEGEMYINGKETSHYTEKEFEDYRRKYIANIFQSFNLINSYTVYQNVELVLLLNGYKKKEVKQKILDIIEKVGLTKFKNTKVSKLSGGQKQRVAIARAMVKDTPIIVADEPTGNLDSESAKEVIEILKKVAKNKLVIIVTHNVEQVEQYATRIIKMNDGRIVENTEIKKVDDTNIKVKESKFNKISIANKYRLGIRNTFNIFTKFILLFAVFFFVVSAIFLEYASFQLSEDEEKNNTYNIAFRDLSENRILINKIDKTAFTSEEFEKIKNLDNVDYIVEQDLFLDDNLFVRNNDISFYGTLNSIENMKENIDEGRMPENDYEIIMKINEDQYYVKNSLNKLLNQTFTLYTNYSYESEVEVRIVGIIYLRNSTDYNAKFYVPESILNNVEKYVNKNYSSVRILFNDKYIESNESYYNILPSANVEEGSVIVNDDMKYEFTNMAIRNKPLNIYVSNIYYREELNLTVGRTFTKNNIKRVTGYDNYNENLTSIFINDKQYEALYDKDPYQSSVFVKDVEKIDQTLSQLENMGIKAKKISDFSTSNSEGIYLQIIRITKVIITIILVTVLFFISYFIIRIILKSRNIYYTTLRLLGATYKSVRRILDIELFINSTLAYGAMLIFIHLVNVNIINFEYVSRLVEYIGLREYVLMYVIIFGMSKLITKRFSKKLFKNTAMNTYNEEV